MVSATTCRTQPPHRSSSYARPGVCATNCRSVPATAQRSSIALASRPSGRSGKVSFTVSCARKSGGCVINPVVGTSETLRSRQRAHTRSVSRVTTVGAKTVKIAAGKSITVTITLSPAGHKLIAALKRLRVRFTLSLVVGTRLARVRRDRDLDVRSGRLV